MKFLVVAYRKDNKIVYFSSFCFVITSLVLLPNSKNLLVQTIQAQWKKWNWISMSQAQWKNDLD